MCSNVRYFPLPVVAFSRFYPTNVFFSCVRVSGPSCSFPIHVEVWSLSYIYDAVIMAKRATATSCMITQPPGLSCPRQNSWSGWAGYGPWSWILTAFSPRTSKRRAINKFPLLACFKSSFYKSVEIDLNTAYPNRKSESVPYSGVDNLLEVNP